MEKKDESLSEVVDESDVPFKNKIDLPVDMAELPFLVLETSILPSHFLDLH